MFNKAGELSSLVTLLCMIGALGCNRAEGQKPNATAPAQHPPPAVTAQRAAPPASQPASRPSPEVPPSAAESTTASEAGTAKGTDAGTAKDAGPPVMHGFEPDTVKDPQSTTANEGEHDEQPELTIYQVEARVMAAPCEEFLRLGHEAVLKRYVPHYERRVDWLRVQDKVVERYQQCRTETYRELFGKLSPREQLAVNSVRNNVRAYIGALNSLRALCSSREDAIFDRREVLARMRLEDVLAEAAPLLTGPESQQAPRCGEQDFTPLRQKATALIQQPCKPPKGADEEERLLHQRSRNNYQGGFSSTVDGLNGLCKLLPQAGMERIFGFTLELIDEK